MIRPPHTPHGQFPSTVSCIRLIYGSQCSHCSDDFLRTKRNKIWCVRGTSNSGRQPTVCLNVLMFRSMIRCSSGTAQHLTKLFVERLACRITPSNLVLGAGTGSSRPGSWLHPQLNRAAAEGAASSSVDTRTAFPGAPYLLCAQQQRLAQVTMGRQLQHGASNSIVSSRCTLSIISRSSRPASCKQTDARQQAPV